jgi:hypothetical protein
LITLPDTVRKFNLKVKINILGDDKKELGSWPYRQSAFEERYFHKIFIVRLVNHGVLMLYKPKCFLKWHTLYHCIYCVQIVSFGI